MRAEAPAAAAEIPARLWDRPARHPERLRFGGDVGNPHHLPRLETFVGDRFVGDDDEVSESPVLVLGELGDLHADHGERRVRADVGREIEPADLWIQEILACRLLWAVQELLPIDNLDDTVLVLKRSFVSSWLHFSTRSSSGRRCLLLLARRLTRLPAGVLQDEEARAHAIRRVHETAVIDVNVVDLNRRLLIF